MPTIEQSRAAPVGVPRRGWVCAKTRGRSPCCADSAAAMFAPIVRERIGDYPGLISSLIEDFTGQRTAEIRQTITATGVPKRLVAPLKVKPGAHALDITRSYLDAKERVFIVSRSIHPAQRFSYESRLRRQSAPNGVYVMGAESLAE